MSLNHQGLFFEIIVFATALLLQIHHRHNALLRKRQNSKTHLNDKFKLGSKTIQTYKSRGFDDV